MNEVLDAETAELLKSLESEGETVETTETPAEEPAVVETQPEAPVPSQEEQEVPTYVDRVPKEPALMPAWEHKIAEKKWEKEREQLTQELEALRANPTQQNRDNVAQSVGNLREMAQQYGLELDERQERFFQSLVSQATAVPEQLTKKLEALEQDRQIAYLETQYENEFLKDVAPLLAEVPAEQQSELRRKLHDLAFSEQYAKVPLKKVFLAEQDTLNVAPTRHRVSMDTTKQGKSRTVVTDYSNLSEDDVAKLSPEEFEKYADSLEGKSKWRK